MLIHVICRSGLARYVSIIISPGASMSEPPLARGHEFSPNFLAIFLVVTLQQQFNNFISAVGPLTSLFLGLTSLYSFAPTYKAFHYHMEPFHSTMEALLPR